MTISEILKAKGISDETIAAVLDEMKTNKIFTSSEENLDIRYGKLKTQHDGVTQDVYKRQLYGLRRTCPQGWPRWKRSLHPTKRPIWTARSRRDDFLHRRW